MRGDVQRLDGVLVAAAAIASHMARGTLADGLVFDTDHVIVAAAVDNDLPPLVAAVERLTDRVDRLPPTGRSWTGGRCS